MLDLMSLAAVIFDLDDTLLDTSALLELRDARDWRRCMARLDRAVPFQVADGEQIPISDLPAAVHARGLAVGLLTHSPRPYAETLLRRFGIKVDAMVTGSDGNPSKPNPTGLQALAAALDVDVTECLYVGDTVGDFGAAAAAGMRSAGVAWDRTVPRDWQGCWPDVTVDRPSTLMEYIDGDERLGPVGEVQAANGVPELHWGSIIRMSQQTYALGRYFSTQDRRCASHALSALVLQAKENPRAAGKVAGIFATLTQQLATKHNAPQMIASVPPRPGQTYDRFQQIRSTLADVYGADDADGLLTMRFEVDGYKSLPHDQRRTQNQERFSVTRDLEAQPRVLLIDDVITSGSQSEDCRRALLEAGARRVDILALAVTQAKLPKACPACGGNLQLLHRGRDGKAFLGCSNFFGPQRCPYTRDA